jgi:RNA polymerase sigma-70 factor (family 1)
MDLYTELPETRLVELFSRGDKSAFAEIYRRHWGTMYFHALKMLEDENEAKDIVQEIFISLWARSAKIALNGTLTSYLFMAVRNKVLNLIRDKKTRAGYIDLFSLYIDEEVNTTLEQIHEKELLIAIEETIQSLPEKMKEIFELSRKGFLSHQQIADQLNISEKTVKRQISNALRILRTKLNKPENLLLAVMLFKH